jgi:hypothetical protein
LQFCMTPEFYFMVWNKSWQNWMSLRKSE